MKRIRKVSQSTPIKAKVVNSYSESEEETYSCDYINNVKANSSDVYTKAEIDEIKTENLTFTNPEKFNEGNLTSVKVGRLVFIVGNFVPNTQVIGKLINLKYKPIYPDRFWGVLHNGASATTAPCFAHGYDNTPYLIAYAKLEANVRYWIDIKYITNE